MDDILCNRLDSCLMEIRKILDIQDTLMKLSVRGVFDINDRQLVLNDAINKTSSEKRQKIVDLLKTRNPSAYWEFCHIIEVRSENLFHLLHDFDEEDGMICTECIAGATFRKCSYCRGLIDVFSSPENGKFIEKPDDLVDLFETMKNQLQSKDQEIKRCMSECSKVKNDYNLCIARSVKDQDMLKQKEEALSNKESEYNRLASDKEDVSIQCERANLKNEELLQKIELLQEKLLSFEKTPVYENDSMIFSTTVERLNFDLKRERQLLETKEQEVMQSRLENSRLRIHNESLEELLKRQRTENNRVFTDLKNSHESLRNQLNASYDEVENLTEDLRVVKTEKEEAMRERDHLLNKVYEKNQALNEAQVNYHTTERELQSTKKINKVQIENIQHLRKFREDMKKQFNQVLDERNKETEKCKRLTEEKDKLVLQMMELQANRDIKSDEKKRIGETENEMQQRIYGLERRLRELTQTHPSDIEVTLKRLEGSRFGVKFGAKKRPVFLGQSKVIVFCVDFTYNATPLANVQEGDFVIAINDVNVQEYEMNQVRSLCPNDAHEMKLVLRRPTQDTFTDSTINCSNFSQFENLDSVGLSIGYYVRVKDYSVAANTGFQDLDEIVKIGSNDLNTYQLNEVKSKLLKSRHKQNDVQIRRVQWNENSKRRSPSRSSSMTSSVASDNVFLNPSASPSSFAEIKSRPRLERPFPRAPQENAFESSDRTSSTSSKSSHNNEEKTSVGRPVPLPREPVPQPAPDGSERERRSSKLHTLEYTKTVGEYSYVASHSFDASGNQVKEPGDEHYKNNLITIVVKKKKYESFGLQMIGGNKAGIYVHAVDNWQPASNSGVQVGYRILKIEEFSMENVAFCYAVDVLQRHCAMDSVTFLFEDIPVPKYQEILKKTPYDFFHVRTLRSYQARLAGEISFRAGENLCVTNSYVFVQPGQPFKWQAMKEEHGGAYHISGLIPRQISPRSPSAIADHTYEEIDAETGSTKIRTDEDNSFGLYYRILEPVGNVFV